MDGYSSTNTNSNQENKATEILKRKKWIPERH